MTLKAVFFDLDGTLLDTAPDLATALNKLLASKNLPTLPAEEVRNTVSNGANALIEQAFGLLPEDPGAPELRQQLLDYYAEDLSSHTTAFDGIEGLLENLTEQGIKWGIVTNKPAPYAEPLMKDFHFASDPVCLICPEHVKQRKPDPEALYLACEQAGCAVEEAIYIGDHLRDIQCGQNAGMPTISVSYGYISANDDIALWQATHSVNHASELWPIIQTYCI